MKRLIHKSARESLQALLPNLDSYNCKCKKEEHWNLFRVLAFNPFIDRDTGAVRASAETIARATNNLSALRAGKFNAGAVLKHFINDIIPGIATLLVDDQGREWSTSTWVIREDDSRYKKEDGKTRRVLVNWPLEVKEIIQKEITKQYTDEKVYISNGNKRNDGKERGFTTIILDECQQEIEILNCKPAKEIADYLNNLPINSFTKLSDNFDKALEVADKLEGHVKQQQLLILSTIMEAPKPFVRPSEKTDRLFGHGANITNLKKEVRKALTKGWFEGDLKSAQLAIVATLWNIPEVLSFLETGKSFWSDVLSHLGVSEEAKGIVKDHTYGVIFGMSKERLVEEMNAGLKKFNIEKGGNLFLSHPIISALLKARGAYISKVLSEGYIVDAFHSKFEINKSNVLSLVARQAQSYEMALIHPVFELAKTTEDFSIVLYQFDGVSIKFHNKKRQGTWLELIELAVKKKACELGIFTSLDIVENKEVSKFDILNERRVQKDFELLKLVEEKKNDLPLHATGIYCIFDISSNRAYFGQSIDIQQRLISHRSQLTNKKHINTKLQRAFNKNPANLIGFLAQEVEYSQLDEAESFYINYFKTHKYGFNQVNKLR